jgi:uncharacterized membrane protein
MSHANMTFLPAFIQWLHVGSVVLLIGGFFFLRVILLPSTRVLPDNQKPKLVEAAFRRFRIVVWIALVTILVSGIYNFIAFLRSARIATQDPSIYILVLGIKLFIVFLIFTFGVLLTFPYPVFAPIQKRPSPWLNLTLILGLIVIFLSTFLRRL